ncbi:hypothetical protein [Streptomyces mangrovisoli]|uniref:Transcriptional regulator n=1 Tax=Streptomyces mangrovisoli TaxID=1428628 RepID=A0A1J4P6U5_9ACTN|nr:hypothetical protein [Streptomyces mangrovisoli]OIJ69213.1 hypothetical protein WN71_003915 [Streptomyces mangrovisoli]
MTVNQSPAALPPHVLSREDVRAAIARHDFGALFALARKWGGISYSRMAEACEIKPERVGTLARGIGNITTYEKIVQIADALRIPGRMLGLAPRPWETDASLKLNPIPQQPLVAGNIASSAIQNASTGDGDETVLRRDFFRASVGAGLAVGLPDLTSFTAGRQISRSTPDLLRQRTARLRRLDDILGGGDTFTVYLGEYEATKSLLREGSYAEATGRGLLSVLSEQAQQAGWAAFDAGNHPVATQLYETSHKAALEASDASLAGNALAFLAYQKIGADRRSAVAIATESCRTAGADAPRGVRALLHERLAWAHAVAGNANETERALSAAEDALSENDGDPQPDWVTWVDRNELRIMTGRCWTELQRPLRAVPILQSVLSEFDDTHARDKALYLSWLSESYLAGGEIEQAAVVAGRVLDLSAGVASVRPRQQIAPVLQALTAHRGLAAVAETMEKAQQ